MDQRHDSPTCERASDLIAFVYGEAEEREARDFQLHLQQCNSCREEVASFGMVRESVTAWRDEALAGFISTRIASQRQRKSALAALRQFFDLSPLWLKGATTLAAVVFCVLAGLVIFRSDNNQDVDRLVKEELAKQANVKPAIETPSQPNVVVKVAKPKPKRARVPSSTQFAKSRRPLSKAEREQLAAALRLLSTGDDSSLDLLGDRINQ